MPNSNCTPNTETFGIVISFFKKKENCEQTLHLLKLMSKKGLEKNERIYNNAMLALMN
eukprot:Pgem_evm1s11721